MVKACRGIALLAAIISLTCLIPSAQMRVVPVDEQQGHVALGLTLRHLANTALAAILSHEAYKGAGDPTRYPEQITQGLRAWQPKKFYFAGGFGPGGGAAGTAGVTAAAPSRSCTVDLALYDSMLGRTYAE